MQALDSIFLPRPKVAGARCADRCTGIQIAAAESADTQCTDLKSPPRTLEAFASNIAGSENEGERGPGAFVPVCETDRDG